MSRLASNLKASSLKPKALTDAEEFRREQDGYETEEEEEQVAQEEAEAAEETSKGK